MDVDGLAEGKGPEAGVGDTGGGEGWTDIRTRTYDLHKESENF